MKAKENNGMKKICTLLISTLSAAVLCTAGAFAEEYKDGEIYIFDTFREYAAARGEGLPSGWAKMDASGDAAVEAAVDSERSGHAVKLGNNSQAGILFGANFNGGMMHVSFDLKQTGDSSFAESTYKKALFAFMNGDGESTNSDLYDYTKWSEGFGPGHRMIYTGIAADSEPVTCYAWSRRWLGTPVYSKSMFSPEAWHKFDMFINKDTGAYTVYMDGQYLTCYQKDATAETKPSIALSDITANFKGMIFTSGDTKESSDRGGFLLDNVYIKSYTADDVISDKVVITADDGSGSGIYTSGGRVAVAFSEYMDRAVTKEDIEVINFQTGKSEESFTIENADNMQFDIAFDGDIDPGNYNIYVRNVKGAVTGNEVSNTAAFSTKAGEVIVDGKVIKIPWVEGVKFITYDGKVHSADKAISTTTNQIKIKFSAPVSDSGTDEKIYITQNEETIPCTYKTEDDNCTIILEPTTLFKGGCAYKIHIDASMTARDSEKVNILSGYDADFSTMDDGAFIIKNVSYKYFNATKKGRMTVDVVKTSNTDEKYTLMIGTYKEVYDSELKRNVRRLTKAEYYPLVIKSDERFIKSYTVPSIRVEADETAECYIIGYPNFRTVYGNKAGE